MALRLLCHVYSLLLYTYPRDFRHRYGTEMARVFRDRCRDAQAQDALIRFAMCTVADWLVSATREWFSIHNAPQLAGPDGHTFDAELHFLLVENYRPKPGALVEGAALSLITFAVLSYLP